MTKGRSASDEAGGLSTSSSRTVYRRISRACGKYGRGSYWWERIVAAFRSDTER